MKLNSFRGETCPPSDSVTTTLVVAMRIASRNTSTGFRLPVSCAAITA